MDPREYDWQMGDLAGQDQLPRSPIDYFRAGAQAVVGGLRTAGGYLGVPSGEIKNAADEVVFPTNALERGLQGSSDAQTAIAAGVMGPGGPKKPPPPGAILGQFPTTTPRQIIKQTLENKGYSVNVPSGEIPKEGLMVGIYKNADPRTTVIAPELLKPSVVKQMAETNADALAKVDRHLGTWVGSDGNVYLDVAQRFPAPNIRKATKFGERTNQIAGFDIAKGEEFPIGNYRNFVASPEQYDRWFQMEKVGSDYLKGRPTREWWDIHGTPLERVYGTQNVPQVAGFSAATAPNTNPTTNMSVMSEYMRRHIAGEPIVQPGWRMGPGGMMLSEGKKMPMEQSRIANLEKAAAGDVDAMRRAKVRSEAQAMTGNPDVAVIDRWHVRGTEAPERGIFASSQEGVINTNIPKKGVGDYDFVQGHMREAAKMRGRDLRDWSADVWTGLRETAKKTGELFGTKFRKSAVQGESQSYADTFQDLINRKAKHMGISPEELDHRLQRGEANLLSQMLVASPALWAAYQSFANSQAPGELARQDQYD